MRTLLRQKRTRAYWRAPEKWTQDLEQAWDFKSVSRAVELVERAGYQNMELVFVFEEPRRLSTVPVDRLHQFRL